MWKVSAAAYDTLASGHQVITGRVTALTKRHGRVGSSSLPLREGSGSVAYDGKGDVRASCTLTIADPDLWPGQDGFGVLSPYGSELLVERGIGLLDGTVEWVPLMVGPIVAPSRKRPDLEGIQVVVKDRASWVKRSRLFPGEQTVSTNTIVEEITRLVRFTLPDTVVVDRSGSDHQVTKVDLSDKDRWSACRRMAHSMGCTVYFDRIGQLVIAADPTLEDDPVWTFDVGSRGTLVDSTETIDSERFFNVFIATQVVNTGTSVAAGAPPPPPPLTATVTVDDPDDPLYAGVLNPATGAFEGGNHPPVPRFFASPMIYTQEHVQTAAEALRERCRGLGFTSGITSLPNPLLEPDDVVRVRYGDGSPPAVVVLEAFDVGLSADTGPQSITLRGAALPEEDEQVSQDQTEPVGAPAAGAVVGGTPVGATDVVPIVRPAVPAWVWNELERLGYHRDPTEPEVLVGVPRSLYNQLLGIVG